MGDGEGEEDFQYVCKCEICGCPATRYSVVPICDNPVCFELRLEKIGEMIKEFNNNKGNDNGKQECIVQGSESSGGIIFFE